VFGRTATFIGRAPLESDATRSAVERSTREVGKLAGTASSRALSTTKVRATMVKIVRGRNDTPAGVVQRMRLRRLVGHR
jgi:hypothetical protein